MSDHLIKAIRVEKLFGMYTYNIPGNGGVLTNAAILYGDNGIGKSTILRMAFHLLSSANNRGHRTALHKIPFKSMEVDLASGVTLSAKRDLSSLDGPIDLSISNASELVANWIYQPSRTIEAGGSEYIVEMEGERIIRRRVSKGLPSNTRGEKVYLESLASCAPTVYILNAERRLDSDSVPDPSDELELRKVMRYEEPKRIHDLVVRSREIALSQALGAASRWISQKAFQGANQGSMNVHSVYVNVLRQILSPAGSSSEKPAVDPATLLKKLAAIETRSEELAKYEFTAKVSVGELKKPLIARGSKKQELASNLLQPYIDSLEGRLSALSDIYSIVDRFVNIVNEFLSDKSIHFKLSRGFSIKNRLGSPLDPTQLSSGEQQLLLLFCYVLTSRDNPSVFMIDEPEISLNVKWQRRLVQSLLDITIGSRIQFVFASHSLELLTQHRGRVVSLEGRQ